MNWKVVSVLCGGIVNAVPLSKDWRIGFGIEMWAVFRFQAKSWERVFCIGSCYLLNTVRVLNEDLVGLVLLRDLRFFSFSQVRKIPFAKLQIFKFPDWSEVHSDSRIRWWPKFKTRTTFVDVLRALLAKVIVTSPKIWHGCSTKMWIRS